MTVPPQSRSLDDSRHCPFPLTTASDTKLLMEKLIVTRAPSWSHQKITGRIFNALDTWPELTGLGEAALNSGIILTDEDNVIPDVVWAIALWLVRPLR